MIKITKENQSEPNLRFPLFRETKPEFMNPFVFINKDDSEWKGIYLLTKESVLVKLQENELFSCPESMFWQYDKNRWRYVDLDITWRYSDES
jgi:hypothetical protein